MTTSKEQSDNDRRNAVAAAQEFVKYLVALGTGSMVLSADLLKQDVSLPSAAKWVLLLAWLSLGISIVGGALAYSRTVLLLSQSNYNLQDRYLEVPGRIQQVTFLLGVAALGVTLALVLRAK